MIVTDRFVYVHMPKTGGTFVTEVLKRIHRAAPQPGFSQRAARGVLRRLGFKIASPQNLYGPISDLEPKHGTCHDVPDSHRGKPILSTMRNPYDWYVSQFEFAWWKRASEYFPEKYPTPVGAAMEKVLPEFVKEHPRFPEITFPEFVELCDRAAAVYNVVGRPALGLYTHGFIRFFFQDIEQALVELGPEYIDSGKYRSSMFNLHFTRTNGLNLQLFQYLLSAGYRRRDVDFILGMEKILPMGRGRNEDQPWDKYYTPELKRYVREKDWALFRMFPEYDA